LFAWGQVLTPRSRRIEVEARLILSSGENNARLETRLTEGTKTTLLLILVVIDTSC